MTATKKPIIGFVGIGNQGGPIAKRISAAGYETFFWARRPDAAQAFKDENLEYIPSVEHLASMVDVFFICVVDDKGVNEIISPALPNLKEGAIVVILSTIHPATCLRLAVDLKANGVKLIDAPVSGGAEVAKNGNLAVMVGGAIEDFNQVLPVLKTFGSVIERLGDIGAGQKAKLVNNCLMAANFALAAEAVNVGKLLGLDEVALNQIIGAGSGQSFAQNILAKLPSLQSFGNGSKLLEKDIRLLEALSSANRIKLEHLGQAANQMLKIVK